MERISNIVLRCFYKSIKVIQMEKNCFTFLVITCISCMQIRYSWFYFEFRFIGPRVISQKTDYQYEVLKRGVICSHNISNKMIRSPSSWIFWINIFALFSTKEIMLPEIKCLTDELTCYFFSWIFLLFYLLTFSNIYLNRCWEV